MPTQPSAQPDAAPGGLPEALVSTAVRTGYDENGVEVDPDSTDCVAKSSRDTESGNVRCWIRVHKFGPNAGHFYNPQGVIDSRKMARGVAGLDAYAWVPARQESFDSYLQFLTTKNIICLRKAERL